jgi:hypothetical protein
LDPNNTLVEFKTHLVPFHTEIDYRSPLEQLDENGVINIFSSGIGTATHMGLVKMEIYEIVDTHGFDPNEWDADADVVLTAANGDELHFSYTSTIDPADFFNGSGNLYIVGACIVTGGTGRFSEASGTLIYTGVHNVYTSTGTVDFDGTIMY